MLGRLEQRCGQRLASPAPGVITVQSRPSSSLSRRPCPLSERLRPRAQQQPQPGFVGPERVAEAEASALQLHADPAPFLTPLLRSFLLGVSFGAIFELGHVLTQFLSVAQQVGYGELSAELSRRSHDLFSPNIFLDHVGALGSWCLFYVLEAVAVTAALRNSGVVRQTQAEAVNQLHLIPQKLIPLSLDTLKNGLLRGLEKSSLSRLPPALPAAEQAVAPSLPDLSAGPLAFLDDDDIPLPAPERRGDQGTQAPTLEPLPRQEPEQQPSLEDKRRDRGLAPGAWDPSSSVAARRHQELQGRASFLKNFWYAAALSEKVGAEPVGVQLLGEQLVLFRDKQGTVHCLGDVCPHRGAPLHRGWVAQAEGHDCVVCPYHGWAFDKDGILRDVPAAEGDHDWPHRQMLDVFHTVEKGGFVWLFYGSKAMPADERPPIPYVPELDDPSWRPVYGEILFDCPHWSVFENAIDMAHIHYLHSGSFGNQDKPEIRGMTCGANAYGVDASFRLHNKPVNALWDFSKVAEVSVTAKALLPSTSVISFTLGRGLSFTTFVNTVPLDGQRTINRFALVRRLDVDPIGASFFNSSLWDHLARQAMLKILTEDKAMVEALKPQALQREISVKADLVQTAFRKLREEYLSMGYGVAPTMAAERQADY